jgi:TRAP transporter 4TM/12TM fusion protein
METAAKPTARYRTLKGIPNLLRMVMPAAAVAASVYYIFGLTIIRFVLFDVAYYLLLIAFIMPLIFLLLPPRKASSRDRIPWYDILAALLSFAIPFYLFLHGRDMVEASFAILPPAYVYPMLVILLILVFEAARRQAGSIFVAVCLLFAVFPLFASYMPGPAFGTQFSVREILCYHVMGSEGLLGIPMRVVGGLIIGYLIFAGALIAAGGGEFFLKLSTGLLGHVRGGPAKVAVISSGFFGSVSGSTIANVISTGSFTIPAMKRSGYSNIFAGGVEAAASTGGVLMPPIMGATAFLMAEFLGVPYSKIIIAAFVPSILYYLTILTQVDAHAAVKGLKGLPKDELPSIMETLKGGWIFIAAFVVLVYLLLVEYLDRLAPFYATLPLLVAPIVSKGLKVRLGDYLVFLKETGRLLAEIMAPLLGVGLVVNSLLITGVSGNLSIEILRIAGENMYLLILLGAATSFILGMGMTITACYVLLALLLAPALVRMGLDPLATHLFVMYCGMISYITPPVCPAAFAAASIAEAGPMGVGLQAMRLGIAKFFLPFIFVLAPALIFSGPFIETVHLFFSCAIGLALMGGALEGYVPGLGRVTGWMRPFFFIGGLLLASPWWKIELMGLIVVLLAVFIALLIKKGSYLGEKRGWLSK